MRCCKITVKKPVCDMGKVRPGDMCVVAVISNFLIQNYSFLGNCAVLNFFPVLSEDECKTEDGRRSGVCMNVYDCHRKGGSSKGQCALGFGACCVCKCDGRAVAKRKTFLLIRNHVVVAVTASCDQEVKNNITYIVSPSFPALMSADIRTCKLKVKMMSPDISQLRFDFVHFSMVRHSVQSSGLGVRWQFL